MRQYECAHMKGESELYPPIIDQILTALPYSIQNRGDCVYVVPHIRPKECLSFFYTKC